LKIINDYLSGLDLDPEVTTHTWHCDLPKEIQAAITAVANDPAVYKGRKTSLTLGFNSFFTPPEYTTVVLESMNEIYVAATDSSKSTSDNVFYSNHVDGPFMCFPFASVYRAIVAVNENDFSKF
jgi:hypothetical protein